MKQTGVTGLLQAWMSYLRLLGWRDVEWKNRASHRLGNTRARIPFTVG